MVTRNYDTQMLFNPLSIGDQWISSITTAVSNGWSVASFTPTRTLSHVPTTTDLSNVLKTLIYDLMIRGDRQPR